MNLGERIYQLRTEKEMSQGDLAEALEVSRQSISKWETNGSVPELEKIVKLSEIFCVSLDALITGKEGAAPSAVQEAEPQIVYIEKPVKQRSTRAHKWCIALCSLVCVLLLVNLFLLHLLSMSQQIEQDPTDFKVTASDAGGIDIEWNAGSVRITSADTDKITVAGVSNEAAVSIEVVDDLLKIQPKADASLSGIDLIITVPKDWNCRELKLKGTSTTMNLDGISVGTLDLNGSSCTVTFQGSLEKANINGTSVTATLNCTSTVSTIQVNGNRTSLMLSLPKECGFMANLNVSNCVLHSDISGVRYENHKYSYGNQHCKIGVYGSVCDIFVTQGK